MAQEAWLKETNLNLICPECSCEVTLRLNLLTYEHRILTEPKASFRDRMRVIERFKALKGYDRIPTWDSQNRGRALKAAGRILHFFRKLEDPTGVAIECLEETYARAVKDNWPTKYQLETTLKLASDWLLEKLK